MYCFVVFRWSIEDLWVVKFIPDLKPNSKMFIYLVFLYHIFL